MMSELQISNENYVKTVELCKELIKQFELCELKQDVLKRIYELVLWLEKQKSNGIWKGGFQIIFTDLLRAADSAESLSDRGHRDKCYYFRKWLSLPFTEKGGLGYWTTIMSQ
jgi:hypothetical protein